MAEPELLIGLTTEAGSREGRLGPPSVRNSIQVGMVEALDNSPGALVAKLEAPGLLENALILVLPGQQLCRRGQGGTTAGRQMPCSEPSRPTGFPAWDSGALALLVFLTIAIAEVSKALQFGDTLGTQLGSLARVQADQRLIEALAILIELVQ